MNLSRPLACFAGSFLLALSGRTAESTATALTITNITFRNHIQPLLAKMGCSSGACHGAAAGQNGFKLSLRGYDDEGDFLALTRNALGRRIVPTDPGRSLLLLKPTTAVPHKGGKRFDVDSLEYNVLSEWIAAGTPGPKPDDPRIDQLQILPEHAVLKPGAHQQLLVRAHFIDGHTEDVTRWTKYTAANASVTQVDDYGKVQVVGHGEGAVTAWYLSRIAIGTITVPYTNAVAPAVFAKASRRNFIDQLVLEKLQSLNLPPSPRCSDEEFIRRAFLDTLGTLPSADETRAFLAEAGDGSSPLTPSLSPRRGEGGRRSGEGTASKRDQLIESLLARPEFVDYWTYKWSDLLLVQSKKLKAPAMWSYYILTAQGGTLENGAANFYVLHEDPRLMAETTTQAFLGMSVNCARCHNHPMEKWTNKQYYQFANLFARVRAKTGASDGEDIIFVSNSGDIVQPLTGKRQPPAPLDGNPLPFDVPQDRREALADWLTSPDNPYFSRSIVNRIWANFFGVGIVDPVDDLRATNPASNEKLLSAAAKYLADQKFDLKALMRAILQSETYQRTSAPLPENAADSRFYARYYQRRLMAEVLLDAYSQVTGVPTEFRTDLRNENRGLGEKYPLGFRAIQLPDTKIASYFLKTFGRPDREKTCECERTSEPNVAQMLHIANGDTLNQKLMANQNAISRLLADKTSPEKIVEEAYLGSLSRDPTGAEKEKIVKMLKGAEENERRPLIEDMYWALLSSKEFLFNH
ncbi:MAG: S-layer protein [Verrucomicrobia bacterium]|nr:MAG: S-layer protein [Verrucomicrobiota bacterium]